MHRSTVRPARALTVALVGIGLVAASVSTANGGTDRTTSAPSSGPVVRRPVRFDVSAPLVELQKAGRAKSVDRQIEDVLGKIDLDEPDRVSSAPDPVVQDAAVAAMPAPVTSFDGMNNTEGVVPPDTNGDIGPNHYVQTVNTRLAVYSRAGTLLYGPAPINTLWAGFGGPCQTYNDGDPVVLYDEGADRWLVSQFALPDPYYQCIAISTGPNPTGSWYRYQYLISTTKLNDYPKFGVWPDAYYMSVNQFIEPNWTWGGAGAAAFERGLMLAGNPAARMVYFDVGAKDLDFGGMLPGDVDGSVLPPAGAPNPFVEFDDNAWGWPTDRLHLWNFHVDWSNTANSTFGSNGNFDPTQAMTTAAFDSNLCNYGKCIQQPGTNRRLDTLSDRLMFRLAYRSFGTYDAMVVAHSVDVGADRAGVRWYELRRTTSPSVGSWSIFQQGTFAPDAVNRWMPSIAMDESGNIAVGYSVSKKRSPKVFPGIRYAGRLAGDPLGTMGQGEAVLINGTGVQTDPSGRWGDYASMSVDPVDDCTFWFTTEYYASTGSRTWRTRIGSFRFPGCA